MKYSFMPDDHEELKTEKRYWKPSQFEIGDTKFRIMSKPIGGWVDWCENKPFRYRAKDKPKVAFDPTKPMKVFWACYVWDYQRQDLFILDITQRSIIQDLTAYGKDDEWGDFTKYDIKIKKEGSGKDTKYQVIPLPHKNAPEEALKRLRQSPVRLEALYEGGDPWADLELTNELLA